MTHWTAPATLLAWMVATSAVGQSPPNIVLILADDLGFGELGSYGQQRIQTPHLDRLAAEGMRFTQHYAGAPVCAPSRCVLLTGQSSSHAQIRGNREVQPEGQHPLIGGTVTLSGLLRQRGYVTGAFGKWGLGGPGSTGAPENQGIDEFFGYGCQRQAHNYFPKWLWRNDVRITLVNPDMRAHVALPEAPESFDAFQGQTRGSDLIVQESLRFLERHRKQRFFLFLPFLEPHLALQPPQRLVDRYPGEWDSAPYLGGKGYLPHPRPRAGYAAMITHLDEHVGRVMDALRSLGLDDRTLVLFTSDNGPTHDVGGVDTGFFQSTGGLRGRKGSLYEGGVRVPLIARWHGRIASSTVSDHLSAFQDHLPTLIELAGGVVPRGLDGISFVPTLQGATTQREHDFLTWEFAEYGGQHSIRKGRYKAIRRDLYRSPRQLELYDLVTDPDESDDLAADHPDLVEELDRILHSHRTRNANFLIPYLDR